MASALPGRDSGRRLRVGLDIGGTKVDAVVLGDDDEIIGRVRRPSAYGDDGVISDVVGSVDQLMREIGRSAADVASVGVGIPGLVDTDNGRVLHAVNLGVESLDLSARTENVLGAPVVVENDVKAATRGAAALSGTASDGSMAYLNLGTGVAAGIIIDGEIWRGSGGIAGEVGHLSVDPRGRVCGCGQSGCIETFCGGGALARAWARPAEYPVLDIFDAADHGDDDALMLRAGLFHGAAAAVRVLVLSADVATVVLGGGLASLGDRLLDGIRAALRADAANSPFLRSLHLDERIELLPTGSPAAALGAALVGAIPRKKENAVHG
ncbi:ROK family protein [Microbacterium sp. GXF6406]